MDRRSSLPTYEEAMRICKPATNPQTNIRIEVHRPNLNLPTPTSVENSTSGLRCMHCNRETQTHLKYHITCKTHVVFLIALVPFFVLLLVINPDFQKRSIFIIAITFAFVYYGLVSCLAPKKYCSNCNNRI
ncbi:uncharacterized protein LOC129577439 isoform X3 [Sitodiplosis mosellana]|uniref:uncharacterized protein LOC129577439 isoform X3 n=1 Tax=Sitodiplosis mosellana TaxID=263140 RepID=UPI0024439349|nr:uncharacterized protein LOC129577439 isoform X3 [Sitodiplosis mosellana]